MCGLLLVAQPLTVDAAACVSAGTGNWSATTTWTSCGSTFPGTSDTVTIATAHTVTVDVDSAATSLTVNNGASATALVITAGKTLAVSGVVTIANPTVNTATTTLSVDGGSLTAGSIDIKGANTNRIAQLTIGAGTVTVADSVTFTGAVATKGAVVFTGNGMMNLTGNLGTGGTLTTTGGFGTINFNGSTAQIAGTYTSYNNLAVNNTSGGVTFAGTSVLGGTLLVNGGTLDIDAKTVTVTGTTTVNGTLRISNTTGTKTFGDITIGSGGVMDFTAAEAVAVNGNLVANGTGAITGTSGVLTFQRVGGGTIGGTAPSITIPGTATFATAYTLPPVFTATALTIGTGITQTNTGTTTVNGTLSGAGTFTQCSGTTLNARSITVTTLNATATGNMVSYIGPANGTLKGTTYVNLDINKSAGFSASLSGTSTVTGSTTVTSGTLNFGSGTFTAEGSTDIYGTLTDTSGGGSGGNNLFKGLVTLHSGADWTAIVGEVCDFHFRNGLVLNGTSFTSSTGFYHFETNDQSISGTLLPTFDNLQVDGIHLTSLFDINVIGSLALTSGLLTMGTHTLSVASSGSVTRTSGYVIGNLQKTIELGAANEIFEIGDATAYAPISLAFGNVTTQGTLTASTSIGNHPKIASSTMNAAKSVARYWSLRNNGLVFDTYSALFDFTTADIIGGADPASFIVARYDGSLWTYPTVGTRTSLSTEITGVTSFSDFQIGERLSSDKAITSFLILGDGTVTESGHTIAVSVPAGTGVASLTPTIVVTGLSVSPVSGVAGDFTMPKTYTVTAVDGSTQDYVVTVTIDPSLTFSAATTTVAFGTGTTLTWSTTNAANCTASGGWSGAQATSSSGVSTGNLSTTTTFILTCTNSVGVSTSSSVVIAVVPNPTVAFVSAVSPIAFDTSTTLTWSTTNANTCVASNGWSGAQATSGSTSTGNLATTTTYTLICTNSIGISTSSNVTVVVQSAVVVLPPLVVILGIGGGGGVSGGRISPITRITSVVVTSAQDPLAFLFQPARAVVATSPPAKVVVPGLPDTGTLTATATPVVEIVAPTPGRAEATTSPAATPSSWCWLWWPLLLALLILGYFVWRFRRDYFVNT